MRVLLNITVLIFLVIQACNEPSDTINNEELIFTRSFPISVPAYTYTDPTSGESYTVLGDSGTVGHVDTVSTQPVVAWDSKVPGIFAAAIFIEPIEVLGGEIQNTENIIWEWNSGMESEYSDTIHYAEGKRLENGTVLGNIPEPLAPGHYYWAVWGWGNTGVYILYSSREFDFYVVN